MPSSGWCLLTTTKLGRWHPWCLEMGSVMWAWYSPKGPMDGVWLLISWLHSVPGAGRIAVDTDVAPAWGDNASQAVARLKAAKVDSIFLSTSNHTVAVAFLKAAAAGGLRVPMYSGDALAEPLLLSYLDNAPRPVLGQLTVTELYRGPHHLKHCTQTTLREHVLQLCCFGL